VVQEDEELEDWEMEEGEISGDIVLWEPDHELYPPNDTDEIQIIQDRLAIAADAIQMQDTESTFRFAKTLTLPFMGAGVVDLPTGA
jgi:centromere protein C